MAVSHSSTTPHASSLKIIQASAFIDLMGTTLPVCGTNKRNSHSDSESRSGKSRGDTISRLIAGNLRCSFL